MCIPLDECLTAHIKQAESYLIAVEFIGGNNYGYPHQR
jgi:hypothetical protein